MAIKRKSTQKKAEEIQKETSVVDTTEVIEPIVEETAIELQSEVVEPMPPSKEPEPQSEEEPLTLPEIPQHVDDKESNHVSENVQQEEKPSRQIVVGSRVYVPGGKLGTVVRDLNKKNYVSVRLDSRTNKLYNFQKSQLRLV